MTDSTHTVRPPTPDISTTTSTAQFDLPAEAFALANLSEWFRRAHGKLIANELLFE
jgi:hypothetical protein